MSPSVTRRASALSPAYLASEEFILFIVRFGLRLTASRWGMSERTLRRLFEASGTNPRRIIRDFRRRETQRLLASNEPLPDLARHLGFTTEKIFSRWVFEQFGSTPTALRRSLRRPA